jgi:radical SAM protein with 4Fe4S-binding SPASM domain
MVEKNKLIMKLDKNKPIPGDEISETFCVLPWIHLNTWPNGNVYPCCLTDWRNEVGNMKDNTLEEIWNNDKMKDIRKKMLEGKKHSNCDKCYQQESYGLQSTRIASNGWYRDHIPTITNKTNKETGHNDDFKLLYWDFRFSNLCNFKCRMCGSYLSSKWYDDDIKIFGGSNLPQAIVNVNDYSKKDIGDYIDGFINTVEEIYFAGGEPLIMDEHYMILEKLIEIGNLDVRLRYNTNLSNLKFKKWDLLELWKPFKERNGNNVSVFASIDGHGIVGEYVRKGTIWSNIEKNIKTLLDNDINLHVSATTMVYNAYHVTELVDRLAEIGVPYHSIHLNNVLTSPLYYHMNILPQEHKDKIKDKLYTHLDKIPDVFRDSFRDKYDSIINFLNEEPQDIEYNRHMFKMMTLKLDVGRGENFHKVCPELSQWFNEIPYNENKII